MDALTLKLVEVRVPITELHYVGSAKIKTNGHRGQTRTNVITHGYKITYLLEKLGLNNVKIRE